MSKKEIVYVMPNVDAGVVSVVRNLLKYKNKEFYYKVILLQPQDSDPAQCVKGKLNCDEQVVFNYSTQDSKYSICKRFIAHLSGNSILVSNDGNIELCALSMFKLNIPVVYIVHGNFEYYFNIIRHYQYLIDRIICVSHFLSNKVKTIVTCTDLKQHIQPIHFPVPDIYMERQEGDLALRMAFVGLLNERKGVLHFKKLLDILDSFGVDYSFSIAGDGELEGELRSQIEQNKRVRFVGRLSYDEVVCLHQTNDVILLMSEAEGLPVCVVEAMKCGVVPVVFDIPSGIPELVLDDETGYRVPQGDVQACAEKISELHSNREKLNQLKAKAVQHANRLFDPAVQTAAYEEIYLDLIDAQVKKNWPKISLKRKLLSRVPNKIIYTLLNLKNKI